MVKPIESPAGQRIAKLLARAGIASRREIERMIADGRVARDGGVIDTPATLLTSLSGVTVDGKPVNEPEPARLFRYHKPAGLLTAAHDPKGRRTIYDALPRDLPRVIPVGRLDLNTEGLLLLTTDGELKRQLELPSTGVARSYRARAFGTVSQEQLEELIHGITIEGVRYGAIDANLERRTGRNQWIEMSLTEGKNREVRRVLEHLGLRVSRLIRTAYGPFGVADLPPGAVEEVRRHDLEHFRASLRGGPKPPLAGTMAERSETPPPRRRAPPPARPADRPAKPAPPAVRTARPSNSVRPGSTPRKIADGHRERELHTRPSRAEAAAPEARAKPKRGAGWAKAKPKPRPKPRSGPRKPRDGGR